MFFLLKSQADQVVMLMLILGVHHAAVYQYATILASEVRYHDRLSNHFACHGGAFRVLVQAEFHAIGVLVNLVAGPVALSLISSIPVIISKRGIIYSFGFYWKLLSASTSLQYESIWGTMHARNTRVFLPMHVLCTTKATISSLFLTGPFQLALAH